MKLLFWMCFALVGYAYVGYAGLLWLLVRVRERPIRRAAIFPSVSVVIAARNEGANLPSKLENLRSLDYPKDRLQGLVFLNVEPDTRPVCRGPGSRKDA